MVFIHCVLFKGFNSPVRIRDVGGPRYSFVSFLLKTHMHIYLCILGLVQPGSATGSLVRPGMVLVGIDGKMCADLSQDEIMDYLKVR